MRLLTVVGLVVIEDAVISGITLGLELAAAVGTLETAGNVGKDAIVNPCFEVDFAVVEDVGLICMGSVGVIPAQESLNRESKSKSSRTDACSGDSTRGSFL